MNFTAIDFETATSAYSSICSMGICVVENNKIVDVYPLITIMNDKNTLMVSPLNEGKTRVCVLKNGKEKIIFNIKVEKNKTFIDSIEVFKILSLDSPHKEFILDEPPVLKEVQ